MWMARGDGSFFFFNDTATTEIYTLSLHDALPICGAQRPGVRTPDEWRPGRGGRASAHRCADECPIWTDRVHPGIGGAGEDRGLPVLDVADPDPPFGAGIAAPAGAAGPRRGGGPARPHPGAVRA